MVRTLGIKPISPDGINQVVQVTRWPFLLSFWPLALPIDQGCNNQSQPGAGLGLFLVEQIARMHGGQVSVASQPGQGSCFTLQLPAG
jgi:light-regulated signal transduction histidine kinase (bacteriophytochrome)